MNWECKFWNTYTDNEICGYKALEYDNECYEGELLRSIVLFSYQHNAEIPVIYW